MSCDLLPTDAPGPHYASALCATMTIWNMHKYRISRHTAYAILDSSSQDGELETFTADSRLKTFGEFSSITSGQMDITGSISETAKADQEGRMSIYWLPKCLLDQSRLLAHVFAILMVFPQTIMLKISHGELRSKMRETRSNTGRWIQGIPGNYQEISAKKYCAEQKTASVKESLPKSMELADQLLPDSLMVQRGELN